MADILRIKRRTTGAPGAPSGLANAEIAYNEVDHILYYGEGTGGAGGTATTVIPLAGRGAFLPLGGGSLTGPLTLNADPGNALEASTKQYVDAHYNPGATVGDTPPATPVPGALWWDSIGGQLYVRFADPNSTEWVQANSSQSPISTDAPNDGKIYGRMNVAWVESVTKQYVDNAVQGIDAKASARVATTGNITLSGVQTIDGVAVVDGDRVLVKDQTALTDNGIYVVTSGGSWTRAIDVDTWNEFISAFVFIESGSVNADSGWLCTVDQGGTIGVTGITWVQFSGAGQITGGAGLVKTGNILDVVGTANRIVVNPDSVDIASNYIGQSSINTVGLIQTGRWAAQPVEAAFGGTGVGGTLTGYVHASGGNNPFTSSATIPNTDIAGLGSMSVQNANAVAITGGTIDGITLDCGTF